MPDLRTTHDRDADLYARIARDGGFSLTWLASNRDLAASLHRLIAAGRVRPTVDWVGVGEAPVSRTRWVHRFWAKVFGEQGE